MPITFCHPAIILPFKLFPKKWFSIVGLVAGSMMPDFEYFLKLQIDIGVGHSIRGIFLFNVPVAIILIYVFIYIVSKELINNLPLYFKSRLWYITQIDWHTYFKKNWYIVIISIIIGTVSHVILDAFTHYNGFFVLKYPVLLKEVPVFSSQYSIYDILQYGISVLGGLIILFYISTLKPEPNVQSTNIFIYWLRVIIIAIIIFSLRIGIGGFGKSVLITSVICSIAVVLYGILLTPILFRKNAEEKI